MYLHIIQQPYQVQHLVMMIDDTNSACYQNGDINVLDFPLLPLFLLVIVTARERRGGK